MKDALSAAAKAHHDFESNFLRGVRDEEWARWYEAYVLGRLGNFTTPTQLTKSLEDAPLKGDWAENAAVHVVSMIGKTLGYKNNRHYEGQK